MPASVGQHPLLGFEPLHDPSLPIAPASVYLRTVTFLKEGDHRRRRIVPTGTEEALEVLRGVRGVEFPQRDGTTAVWRFHLAGQESSRGAAKRAKETGGASRLRGEAHLREIREQIARAQHRGRE